MISLSEKEEFLTNIQKLKEKAKGESSKIILHEIAHSFDIREHFQINSCFISNLLDMYNFYKTFPVKDQNTSEKNALAYELTLCNLLNQKPDFDTKEFIIYNYNFQDFNPYKDKSWRNDKNSYDYKIREEKASQIYDDVCLIVKSLSFEIQKELFLFAKNIISKWANSPLIK
jgi:hypothetical protein